MKVSNRLFSDSHHKDQNKSHASVDTDTSVLPDEHQKQSTALFSPALKGMMIGAVAGRFLPLLNTFTGAIVGGVTAKVLEHRHKPKHAH